MNPFRSNQLFVVIVKTFVDQLEVKDQRERRVFNNRKTAAEFAQNSVFFGGRKQVTARIYAL